MPPECAQSIGVMAAALGPTANSVQIEQFCSSSCLGPLNNFYLRLGQCITPAATVYMQSLLVNMTAATAQIIADSTSKSYMLMPKYFEFVCTRKAGTNEYCYQSYLRMSTDLASTASNPLTIPRICTLYSNMGCCLASLDDIYVFLANVSIFRSLPCPEFANGLPQKCPAPGTTAQAFSVDLTLSNLNFGQFATAADSQNAIIRAIRDDLANCTAGSSLASFSVSGCTGSPAKCNVILQGIDDAATQAQGIALKACLASSPSFAYTTAALTALGVAPPAALGLEGSPAVTEVTLSGTPTRTSSATSWAPSLLFAAVMGLLIA